MRALVVVCGLSSSFFLACGGSRDNGTGPIPLPAPSCKASPAGGSTTVEAPELVATLGDRFHEAWQASPAVADLDGDGVSEILVAREGLLLGFHLDGTVLFRAPVSGRIWAAPVVADLLPGQPGLEIAAAARDEIHAWDATGKELPGFPRQWRDEIRSLAAGDIDGDGELELVAVTTSRLEESGQRDTILAINMNGSPVSGFPPNTTGASGCDDRCYVTGSYDQNVALGDVDGDGVADILVPHDNAYISLHQGNGQAFDAAPIFRMASKFMGIRMLHDYALAQQGYADDEDSADQAHFTNTAPAIVDIDGDGDGELVMLASVQNASQSDRERGVALWVLENDGTRPAAWTTPFHASEYLAGLWDFEGTNIVGATNQVAVADLDPKQPGPEMVFAGFDGKIHAVDSAAQEMWSIRYTGDSHVLTSGVVIADLSGDGIPEIIFNTYSTDQDKGALFLLDAGGGQLHSVPLPRRGAMPVPTIADVDGDGQLEIVVSLKDGEEDPVHRQVLVYTVPGSSDSCMLWTTGRGNLRRDGYIPPSS